MSEDEQETYKRPLWAWVLILAFGGLIIFAVYAAHFHYIATDQYLLDIEGRARPAVVDREMYEDWCIPRYVWQEIPPCPIEINPPTVVHSLGVGVIAGLMAIAFGHWVAWQAEQQIESLEEFINRKPVPASDE